LGENDQNYVPKVLLATQIGVVVFKCLKFVRQEIGEILCYSVDKKENFSRPLKLPLLRG